MKSDAEELYGWQRQPAGNHGPDRGLTGELTYQPIDPPLRERSSALSGSCRPAKSRGYSVAAVGDRRADRRLADVRERRAAEPLPGRSHAAALARPDRARRSNDADLLPGAVYSAFDTDALLRGDAGGAGELLREGPRAAAG